MLTSWIPVIYWTWSDIYNITSGPPALADVMTTKASSPRSKGEDSQCFIVADCHAFDRERIAGSRTSKVEVNQRNGSASMYHRAVEREKRTHMIVATILREWGMCLNSVR